MTWRAVSLVVVAACAADVGYQTAAVVDGRPAAADDIHATVAVRWHIDELAFSVCSGTLIEPGVVLTAAHCVSTLNDTEADIDWDASPEEILRQVESEIVINSRAAAADVEVRAGVLAWDDATDDQRYGVVDIDLHPGYPNWDWELPSGLGRNDDLALLFLERDVTGVTPVEVLPATEELVVGDSVTIAGFGEADMGGYLQLFLGETEVAALSEHEILTSGDGADACWGDSGGPAYVMRGPDVYLVGTHSRNRFDAADECGGGGIAGYVPAYQSWIDRRMKGGGGCAAGGRSSAFAMAIALLLIGRRRMR